jgi:hypothetical protein
VLHLFEQKESLKQEKKSTLVSPVAESRANDLTAPQSFIMARRLFLSHCCPARDSR